MEQVIGWVFGALILGGLTLQLLEWIGRSIRRLRGAETPASAVSNPPTPPAQQSFLARDPASDLARSLDATRKAVRDMARARAATIEREGEAADAKIEAATALVQKLGLDTAIGQIITTMEYWPSWSDNQTYDFARESLVDGLTDYRGTETDTEVGAGTGENVEHSFTFDGVQFRLLVLNIAKCPPDFDFDVADAYLEVHHPGPPVTVYSTSVTRGFERDFEPWRASIVKSIHVGEWVHHIVKLQELLAAKEEMGRLERSVRYKREAAKDL